MSAVEHASRLPRRCFRSIRSSPAFALVEMLMVIGVIALLAAMLLPVLSKARESANRTKCLSNLRQLTIAFTMYLNENEGRFPRPAQLNRPEPEDWIYFQPGRNSADGALARYVSRSFLAEAYRCPSDDVATHLKASDPLGHESRYEFSYAVNERICRIAGNGRTLRLSQIRSPSQKILLIDESAATIDDGCWAWQPSQGDGRNVLAIRHDVRREQAREFDIGRGTVGFVDGHADYIHREESFTERFFDPAAR